MEIADLWGYQLDLVQRLPVRKGYYTEQPKHSPSAEAQKLTGGKRIRV